jgi:hypothetical protein
MVSNNNTHWYVVFQEMAEFTPYNKTHHNSAMQNCEQDISFSLKGKLVLPYYENVVIH